MMTLGDDVKRVKEAMTSPPKKPVRFGPGSYTHIEEQIDRLRKVQHLFRTRDIAHTMTDMLAVVRAATDLAPYLSIAFEDYDVEEDQYIACVDLAQALAKLESNDPQKQKGN